MKRLLEAVLVLAALACGFYVVRQALARRAAAERPFHANPASAPGADAENPGAAESISPRGVGQLPMIKLSRPAKAARRAAAVPPPAAVAP